MRRTVPFVICVCLFTLSIGMTFVALAQDVFRPPIAGQNRPADIAAANTDLVRRFYTDVARVLATGDAGLLDAAVSPDLVEHPARLGVVSGRDGFVRSLLALRATFPGRALVVDDVQAAGEDQVLARVHTAGAESGVFLGRPVPVSFGEWGPLEVWRIADGQLVERWGGSAAAALQPLGQAPLSVDALGPGHRRLTVTRVTVSPGAALAVDNGQAIRVFAIENEALTVDVAKRSTGAVTLAHGPAAPVVRGSGTTFPAVAGDRVVTDPEADYTLTNAGTTPATVIVVIVSNTLRGDLPLNSASAAASWTVAVMPEALGGALPSPAGVSARVLATGVEIELPATLVLALGWMFLPPGAPLVLAAGDHTMVTAVVEGWAGVSAANGAGATQLATGEWMVDPPGMERLWQAGENGFTTLLMLTVG
jgi:predicted ester cyclase